MEFGYCSKCEFKTATQRKFGTTYSCDKEVTHMDVTFFTCNNHTDERNELCPLLKKRNRGGKGYVR